MKSLHGCGEDWPIGNDDLRPFYDPVQREVGISGDAVAEVWRPDGDPYPMPSLATSVQARTIAKGFAALGLRTAPMPQAINSIEYDGRPACLYDGWCDAGCPIGALANPLATYVPRALSAGAEFRPRCTVTRILLRERAGRARIVRQAWFTSIRRAGNTGSLRPLMAHVSGARSRLGGRGVPHAAYTVESIR